MFITIPYGLQAGGGSSKGGRPQKNLKKVKKHELMAKTSNHTYDVQKWAN